MGRAMMQRLADRSDVEIALLCEANTERGAAVLTDLGLDRTGLVSDFTEVIHDESIDAVWLVSPNSFHGPQAVEALEAGKHVFCEKPAATTYDDYRREIELDLKHPELVTLVDYILHFDPMEQRLKKLIAEGAFGQVTQLQVNYRHPVNIAGDKAWKLSRAIMGDALGMGIVHSLYVMIGAMASQAEPVSVFATSTAAAVRPFEPDALWNIMVRFDNGATGLCLGNIDHGFEYGALHDVSGTEGAFLFDPGQQRPAKIRYCSTTLTGGEWVFPLDPACPSEAAWPRDMTTPDSGNVFDHQTAEAVAHFVECAKTGRKSPLGFAPTARVADVGWAARISAVRGVPVALPLDTGTAREFFTRDAKTSEWNRR
jgi:predicted dehydrogenase